MCERRGSTFKQIDVTKAVKGARAAGLEVARIEIDAAGRIVLFARSEHSEPLTPLEKWKQDHGARSA